MKVLRVGYQRIGPDIKNLEIFRDLETVQLQGNCLTNIGPLSFKHNLNLKFISLHFNEIS